MPPESVHLASFQIIVLAITVASPDEAAVYVIVSLSVLDTVATSVQTLCVGSVVIPPHHPPGNAHVPSALRNFPAAASPDAGAGTSPFVPPDHESPTRASNIAVTCVGVRSDGAADHPDTLPLILLFAILASFAFVIPASFTRRLSDDISIVELSTFTSSWFHVFERAAPSMICPAPEN